MRCSAFIHSYWELPPTQLNPWTHLLRTCLYLILTPVSILLHPRIRFDLSYQSWIKVKKMNQNQFHADQLGLATLIYLCSNSSKFNFGNYKFFSTIIFKFNDIENDYHHSRISLFIWNHLIWSIMFSIVGCWGENQKNQ